AIVADIRFRGLRRAKVKFALWYNNDAVGLKQPFESRLHLIGTKPAVAMVRDTGVPLRRRAEPMPSAQATAEKRIDALSQTVCAREQGASGQFRVRSQRQAEIGLAQVHGHLGVGRQTSAERKLTAGCIVRDSSRGCLGGVGCERAKGGEPVGIGGSFFRKRSLGPKSRGSLGPIDSLERREFSLRDDRNELLGLQQSCPVR